MYLKIDYEKLRHLIIENSRRTNLALWLYKYYEKKRVIRRFFHCLMTYCFRLVSYLVQLGHVQLSILVGWQYLQKYFTSFNMLYYTHVKYILLLELDIVYCLKLRHCAITYKKINNDLFSLGHADFVIVQFLNNILVCSNNYE